MASRGTRRFGCVDAASRPARRSPFSKSECPVLHHHRLAADAHCGNRAILLVGLELENARATHLKTLLHDPPKGAVAARITRGEVTAEARAGTAGRRILRNTDARREHTRANVVSRLFGLHGENHDL